MAGPYYVDPSVAPNANWGTGTVYGLGVFVCTKTHNTAAAKYVYECTDAGTSHATDEPTWDATPGNTTADNDVVWTCRAPDSWAKALNDLQGAADLAAAGEIVYCRGTQTITAYIAFDTNSGSRGSDICIIGCNDAGAVDGTRFCLDGVNVVNVSNLVISARSYLTFLNIESKRADYSGVSVESANSSFVTFNNCFAHDNGRRGFVVASEISMVVLIRCVAASNSYEGFLLGYYGVQCLFCAAYDNATIGFSLAGSKASLLFNSVSHSNTTIGVACAATPAILINCVVDENDNDGITSSNTFSMLMLGCRVTNNGDAAGDYGIDITTSGVLCGWSLFLDNYAAATNGSAFVEITDNTNTTTNLYAGMEGYTDGDTDDFNLNPETATAFNVPVVIPWT